MSAASRQIQVRVIQVDEKKLARTTQGDDTEFYKQVADLFAAARQFAKQQLDATIVTAYYEIGRMIVEREQQGQKRAKYGASLIKGLSEYLTEQYGRGFSVVNLQGIRKFYQVYAPSIQQTLSAKSEIGESLISVFDADTRKQQTLSAVFKLGWSHYQILMRIENLAARRFYEIEATSQQWSVRQLRRQVGSSLYERLGLSRDKDQLMALANEGQTVESPRDIFKSPYVLEFTGLEERAEYSESDLEQALIDNLQKFLLELGKGFLFEARQKRFSFDEKSFYVDLVFYNRLLQCYVLIDLKVAELKHQDLGQMLMYVNYFDRYVKRTFENPTIGILLCSKKNDNIVELTLPEDSKIYASAYSLYLPDKSLLRRKLAEWVEEFEEEHVFAGENQADVDFQAPRAEYE
ncbi:MAG: PDDEXK nuclease domain-containing protein [Candidatus Accumulibacter sp.]|jgi:predicted nuclease of restriction endonuclease-like (RecB) superfamily|nr:PDDEXK nuclease domain-containing protein [Accumulibacter sp.]